MSEKKEKAKEERTWVNLRLGEVLLPHGKVKYSGRIARLGDETFKIGGGTVQIETENVLHMNNTERAKSELCPECAVYERGECNPKVQVCATVKERAIELLLAEGETEEK